MNFSSQDHQVAVASRRALSRFGTLQSAPPEPERSSLLEDYFRTLVRHKKVILGCAALGALLAVLTGINTQPIYRTRTSLDIRSINGDFMNMRAVAPTSGGTAADNDTNLQTQIKLLQSDTLLQRVTDILLAQPHPDAVQKGDLLSRLLRAAHVGREETIPYSLLVTDTAQRVKVKSLGLTRLVEITCDSWDSNFSATFCNTLTSTFEQEDLRARSTEAQKTSEWLTQQAADIRKRAEDSQKSLETAVGGNGLMLSQMTTMPGEDRLRGLQEELVKAQSARIERESQDGIARTAAPDTVAAVQDNPAYRAYELKLADLRSQISVLVPPLTEENPRVMHLRAQIKEAEQGLLASQANSTGRADNELAAARHREDLLKITYNAQVASVSSDLQKAAHVSLLRREVESEQTLYQTLLQRAKEAGFASAMQAATIRVIDAAKPPRVPFSPQPKLAGLTGLAVGSLFGIGFSFFRDRHHRVFRVPGDVERYLQVVELGVIPAAETRPAKPLFSRRSNLAISPDDSAVAPQSKAVQITRWNDNFSLLAEAFRSVTFSLLLSESEAGPRSYVVSSPSAGEGKTTITTNIGIALSKSKLRVALIDGDLRRPSLHKAFGIENGFGLRNILRGEVNLDTVPLGVLTHRTWLHNVAIIPAGEGHGEVDELLHSSNFRALLARLTQDFDVVLVDTPPMLHMADARILASQSDGAILVFRASQTMRDEAASACKLFDQDGIHLVGTILNDFDPSAEGKSGYYESYYRYRVQEQASEKAVSGL